LRVIGYLFSVNGAKNKSAPVITRRALESPAAPSPALPLKSDFRFPFSAFQLFKNLLLSTLGVHLIWQRSANVPLRLRAAGG
jgi:hypothetical protein